MASENETVADIIAEKRRRADEIERDRTEKMRRGEMVSDCYARVLVADIRREADRLEAACKRKLSDFNPKCDWSVQEALDFANTLANHGWTREANSDAASSCIHSLCRLLKERGDCAKLREALKQVNELNDLWFDTFTLPDGATSIHDEIENVISAALAATEKEGGAK